MIYIIALLTIFAIWVSHWKERRMSAAFDRLSASIDAAIARINSTTDDTDLNSLADKLDAALGTVAPAPETTEAPAE